MTVGKLIASAIQKTSRKYSTQHKDIYKTFGTRTRDLSFTAPLNSLNVVLLNQAPVSNFTVDFFQKFGATVHKYCEDSDYSNVLKSYDNDYKILKINRQNAKNEIIKIIRQADILIDNLKGNRLNYLHVDCDELMRINSNLIVARTTLFPQLCSKSCEYPSELSITFSTTSISSSFLNSEESNLESPYIVRYAKSVVASAEMFIISKILMALYERNLFGNRQVLNLSLQDCIEDISSLSRKSESKVKSMYDKIYKTKDNGYVVVGICDENDINEFLNDLKFDSTNSGALKNIDDKDIARVIETKTTDEWKLRFKFCGYINILKRKL